MIHRLFLASFSLFLLSTSSQAGPIDPGRFSTTPTGWNWVLNRTAQQVGSLLSNGKRIIDLEQRSNGRFNVVLVNNRGRYARGQAWWINRTPNQVTQLLTQHKMRAIDIEPRVYRGKLTFTFAAVPNSGVSSKYSIWGHGLTAIELRRELTSKNLRPLDIDTYTINGRVLYAYTAVKNTGSDKAAWEFFGNKTPSYLSQMLGRFRGRLVDLDHHGNGRVSAIMIKNNRLHWWWLNGVTRERITDFFQSTGSRIIDLEQTGSNRYSAVFLDNSNAETRRLRGFTAKAFDSSAFGNKQIRGFMVKESNGKVLAGMGHDYRFQPLSTLKLLPYLHAVIEIDKNRSSLGTSLKWRQASNDDPNTEFDERVYQSCIPGNDPNSFINSAQWRHALPTLMWESHNRTLDSFLAKFGTTNMNNRAHSLGLKKTNMYPGCPGPATTWPSNRTTLLDLGKIFEGVESLNFVKSEKAKNIFLDNMINLNNGMSYSSPITGNTTGPIWAGGLETIVKREMGPGNNPLVAEFMNHVVIRGKGGSGGPSSSEFGYSDFLYVTLPHKINGQIKLKNYLVGWYIYKLSTPSGCPENMANAPECSPTWKPERDALKVFKRELFTSAVKQSLKGWGI